MSGMFKLMRKPLAYAEILLAQFSSLSRAKDSAELLELFAKSLALLSECELVQVYLLENTHTRLAKYAECLNHDSYVHVSANGSEDYKAEPLLQFALSQNRTLCLTDMNSSVQDTRFLPHQPNAWQSLLCVPLLSPVGAVEGVVVCASHAHLDLNHYAESFSALGSFVSAQLQLFRRMLRPVAGVPARAVSASRASGYGLIGGSSAMRKVYSLMTKVLNSPCTVLLQGETGTGKELVARAIHEHGSRRSKPFIVHNCAALPENLLESEFFGYRKGAFTGADCHRIGLFDAAEGGTLLLDEVGDMPPSLQAKLLRVLQEGEVRPLGCNETHTINVRVIAATHRNLPALVRSGEFREDLYYRLTQFPIELPPLRQREEDVLMFARHFSTKGCALLQRDQVSWSDAALDYLLSYPFPGNVRELKYLVERALLLCDGHELQRQHFSSSITPDLAHRTTSLRDRLDQVERSMVLDCLRKNGGNQTSTARELGLPRRTLLYRLSRLNIQFRDAHERA